MAMTAVSGVSRFPRSADVPRWPSSTRTRSCLQPISRWPLRPHRRDILFQLGDIQRLQLALRLFTADARLEPTVHIEDVRRARIERPGVGDDSRQHHRRHEEIDRPADFQPVETLLRDPDDGERMPTDAHVPSNDVRPHPEALDPEPVAEHDDGMAIPDCDRPRPRAAGPSTAVCRAHRSSCRSRCSRSRVRVAPSIVRFTASVRSAISPENTRWPSRRPRYAGYDQVRSPVVQPLRSPAGFSRTSSRGCSTGSDSSSSLSMMLKIAVFAPMPRASVSTTTIVNPGCSTSRRLA